MGRPLATTSAGVAGNQSITARRVLVVDDDRLLVATLQKRLEHAGFEVIAALDGTDGYRLAVQHEPEVAIIDVMMPGMDGFDLCRRLKQFPPPGPPKVIILSAVGVGAGRSDDELKTRSGADAFFSKPCRFSDVLAEIRSA